MTVRPPLNNREGDMTVEKHRFHVRSAAVLGAGVMGAQIAAHLVNAGVPGDTSEQALAPRNDTTSQPYQCIARLLPD